MNCSKIVEKAAVPKNAEVSEPESSTSSFEKKTEVQETKKQDLKRKREDDETIEEMTRRCDYAAYCQSKKRARRCLEVEVRQMELEKISPYEEFQAEYEVYAARVMENFRKHHGKWLEEFRQRGY